MSDTYKIESTSNKSATVEDIELSRNSKTRRIIRSSIVNNPNDESASVKIDILHQRTTHKSQFEDITAEKLSTYKAKEIGKISLNCAETKNLYIHLRNMYKVYSHVGTPPGKNEIVVKLEDEILSTNSKRSSLIKKLIADGYSEEVCRYLFDSDINLADRLTHLHIQQQRTNAIDEFTAMINQSNSNEHDWQKFFEKNTWIFGYGLNYKILKTVQNQPTYGGQSYTGDGSNKGDFLKATQGNTKFTVLVEIKKPSTPLLDIKSYRNDVYTPSFELIGGVSQLRMNARTWEHEGSNLQKNRDSLESQCIYTVSPRKILVIGNTSQLSTRIHKENFELFRQNQNDIDIITFDEIYERAKFILDHNDQSR